MSPALGTTPPNHFTLTDRASQTQIVFWPQANTRPNASQLDYQGPEGHFTFGSDQIKQQASPLGRLITVTLQPNADAGQLTLTLILPPVYLEEVKQQGFATFAIKTKSRSRLDIDPQPGAELAYRVLNLQGIASFQH